MKIIRKLRPGECTQHAEYISRAPVKGSEKTSLKEVTCKKASVLTILTRED